MTKITVSLQLSKNEFLKQLNESIANNQDDHSIVLISTAFGNWMLPADPEPVFKLGEMLDFPRDLFIIAVAEQMCSHGMCRSFSRFWEMINQYPNEVWSYEVVMLVYAGLPRFGNYQKILAEFRSSIGYIPDELEVENCAKCWDYLYQNPLPAENLRELRVKYRNLLRTNKNKELLSLLQTVEHEFPF